MRRGRISGYGGGNDGIFFIGILFFGFTCLTGWFGAVFGIIGISYMVWWGIHN